MNPESAPLQVGSPIPQGAVIGTQATPVQPSPASDPSAASLQVGSAIPAGATVGDSNTDANSTDTPIPDALHRDANGNPILNAAKMLPEVGAGIGQGVLDTLNGGANLLHLPHATLQARQNELAVQNRENPLLNATGEGLENLTEFIGGDAALKGLALSDRLMKTAKIAKVLESSPLAMKAFTLGANMLRSGVAQGAISGVKDNSIAQGATQGGIAAGVTGAMGVGGEALTAIRDALDGNAIQKSLQDGIKTILSDVADRTGVTPPTATSIRDTVQQVADGLKTKAKGLYTTLDNISGGQAQRFRDAAHNVSDKLSEIVGLDDEAEAKLVQRQAEIEAAHKAMLDDLEAKGYDRGMLAQADAAWKQQSALSDLSNSIRQSTRGLRPEQANGVSGATTPETVNPKTLFTKVNRLNDRGRLAQAIGQDNADNLLRHVDAAYVSAQKIAQRKSWAGIAAKYGLGAVGLGAGVAHELLK